MSLDTLSAFVTPADAWLIHPTYPRPDPVEPQDTNVAQALDYAFWLGRDLPDEFGKWSSVYRQFLR